jgi:hypothetical protein
LFRYFPLFTTDCLSKLAEKIPQTQGTTLKAMTLELLAIMGKVSPLAMTLDFMAIIGKVSPLAMTLDLLAIIGKVSP